MEKNIIICDKNDEIKAITQEEYDSLQFHTYKWAVKSRISSFGVKSILKDIASIVCECSNVEGWTRELTFSIPVQTVSIAMANILRNPTSTRTGDEIEMTCLDHAELYLDVDMGELDLLVFDNENIER